MDFRRYFLRPLNLCGAHIDLAATNPSQEAGGTLLALNIRGDDMAIAWESSVIFTIHKNLYSLYRVLKPFVITLSSVASGTLHTMLEVLQVLGLLFSEHNKSTHGSVSHMFTASYRFVGTYVLYETCRVKRRDALFTLASPVQHLEMKGCAQGNRRVLLYKLEGSPFLG
jgi:hypothetical protein